MNKGYSLLSEQQMYIEQFDNSYISGRVSAIEDSLLYTSIPYDKGWNVYIDGEKVDSESIVKIGDALLGVDIPAGNHTVEFRYKVPASGIGSAVTVFTVLCIGMYYLFIKRNKNKKKLLPKFAPVNNRYTTDILLPIKSDCAKLSNSAKKLITPTKLYGEKQIIYPPKKDNTPEKLIILPPITIIEEEIFNPD